MNITLDNRKTEGRVRVIESKSFAHRIMLSASLAKAMTGEDTEIVIQGTSQDIEATKRVIKALDNKEAVIDCGESGTTLRFTLPICAALGRREETRLTGHGRLMQRPMGPLIDAMTPHGVTVDFEEETNSLVCRGRMQSGTYEIAANVSSQYISGLLFALPILEGDSVLKLVGKVESRPYIDITLEVLAQFGIEIQEDAENQTFKIKGGQVYKSPGKAVVEGDWSNAAFWMASGVASGRTVKVEGLNLNSIQGDRAVCSVLRQFGADIIEDGDSVICSCRPGQLHGTEISAADIPDMVPVLSVIAAISEGDTLFYDAGRLRIKESDRIETTKAMLNALGVEVETGEEWMKVHGRGSSQASGILDGGTVDGANDHRIVMSAAVAAISCKNPVTIEGAQAVNKSYPGFFEEREILCQVHTENI